MIFFLCHRSSLLFPDSHDSANSTCRLFFLRHLKALRFSRRVHPQSSEGVYRQARQVHRRNLGWISSKHPQRTYLKVRCKVGQVASRPFPALHATVHRSAAGTSFTSTNASSRLIMQIPTTSSRTMRSTPKSPSRQETSTRSTNRCSTTWKSSQMHTRRS